MFQHDLRQDINLRAGLCLLILYSKCKCCSLGQDIIHRSWNSVYRWNCSQPWLRYNSGYPCSPDYNADLGSKQHWILGVDPYSFLYLDLWAAELGSKVLFLPIQALTREREKTKQKTMVLSNDGGYGEISALRFWENFNSPLSPR